MTLTVPDDRVALSNMLGRGVKDAAAKTKTVTFQTTPVMSTYLLALCVGEFDFIEADTPEGVTVRCWTPVGRRSRARSRLTPRWVAELLRRVLRLPYPLPKMYMVAVFDFSAGAMENWGPVYRASLMLYEEGKTPVNAKQRIGYVVGHELAHQWFGNLVTWSGGRSCGSTRGSPRGSGGARWTTFTQWRVWSQFLVNEQSMGPVWTRCGARTPWRFYFRRVQVTEIFDAISTARAAA